MGRDGDETFHFDGVDAQAQRLVDALAYAYGERRLQVMRAVFSRPAENIQVFADAFRLRKD